MATDWELRYQTGDTPWEKGEASPGLVDFLQSDRAIPKGRVLVPGCGCGHDARAWAERGFVVTGLDLAPSAVRLAREKTNAALQPTVEFVEADFLAQQPQEPFDWLFEHTLYCAIDPSCRDAYRVAAGRWLKPGGHFLAVHYLIPDADEPPFGTSVDEVVARFSNDFELLDSWIPRTYPNRLGKERMFWWLKKQP